MTLYAASAAALLLYPRVAASTEVLAVLNAQDQHEVDVHSEFVKWCTDAQNTLTDRLATHQERMNEITGALDSYTENEGRLRSSLSAQHQDDHAGQESSIRLMQSESQVWRSTQVKQLVEKQIESDSSLLSGIKSALAWEQGVSSRHQAARQQLKSEIPKISVVQKAAPTAAPMAAKPASPTSVASAPKDSFSIAGTLENELGPFMGISQLPALQLMQSAPAQAMLQESAKPASHVDQKAAAAPTKAMPVKATPAKAIPTKEAVTKEAIKAPTQPSPVPSSNPGDPSNTFSALTELLQPQALPATPALPQLTLPAHSNSQSSGVTATPPQALSQHSAVVSPSKPHGSAPPAAKSVPQPTDALEDPAKALVGILQGGEDNSAADVKPTTAAPPSLSPTTSAPPLAKAAQASVPATSAPSAQPAKTVATTTVPAPKSDDDPEDALMDVMMSGDAGNADASVTAVNSPNPTAAPSSTIGKLPTLDDFMKQKKDAKASPITPAADNAAFVQVSRSVKEVHEVKPKAMSPIPSQPVAPHAAVHRETTLKAAPHPTQQSPPLPVHKSAPPAPPQALLQRAPQAMLQELPQTAIPQQVPPPAQQAVPQVAALPALPQIDLASVTVGQWKQMQPPADGNSAHSLAFKPMDDADSQVSSLLAEVSKLSGQSLTTAAPVTASSKSTSVLASDLSSLMGLTQDGPAPSFLQVARRRGAAGIAGSSQSRTQMAAAALEADLGAAGVAGRLAKQIAQQDQAKSVEMLTALKTQLGQRELSWGCANGPAAAHAHMVLMLADQGVTLLKAERSTVENLRAEQRGYDAEAGSMRAEFVGMLEETLDRTYEAAASDLDGDDLAPLRQVASSSTTSFQTALLADAKEAKRLGATWVGTGTSYEELTDQFAKEQAAKEDELKKAQRVLAAAGAKAANLRHAVAKEKACAEAANVASLLAAVQRGLHVLQDN